MPKLYLMRHGQTLFNVLKRKQGWCDSPLTELGIEQAHRAGACLAERGVTFDHAYSSTSERAVDTLEVVLGELGCPDMPYERVKGLKEWNFGRIRGSDRGHQPAAAVRRLLRAVWWRGRAGVSGADGRDRHRAHAAPRPRVRAHGLARGGGSRSSCAPRAPRPSSACAATGGASATARSRSMSSIRPRRISRRSSLSTPTRRRIRRGSWLAAYPGCSLARLQQMKGAV